MLLLTLALALPGLFWERLPQGRTLDFKLPVVSSSTAPPKRRG